MKNLTRRSLLKMAAALAATGAVGWTSGVVEAEAEQWEVVPPITDGTFNGTGGNLYRISYLDQNYNLQNEIIATDALTVAPDDPCETPFAPHFTGELPKDYPIGAPSKLYFMECEPIISRTVKERTDQTGWTVKKRTDQTGWTWTEWTNENDG